MSTDNEALPPLPEPAGWRIFDGEGGYSYSDEEPDEFRRAWAARYNRKHEPLFTADQMRDYARAALAQRQQVPMAQTAIVEAFCKLPHPVQFVSAFEAGARFAEQYHGIGKQEQP